MPENDHADTVSAPASAPKTPERTHRTAPTASAAAADQDWMIDVFDGAPSAATAGARPVTALAASPTIHMSPGLSHEIDRALSTMKLSDVLPTTTGDVALTAHTQEPQPRPPALVRQLSGLPDSAPVFLVVALSAINEAASLHFSAHQNKISVDTSSTTYEQAVHQLQALDKSLVEGDPTSIGAITDNIDAIINSLRGALDAAFRAKDFSYAVDSYCCAQLTHLQVHEEGIGSGDGSIQLSCDVHPALS